MKNEVLKDTDLGIYIIKCIDESYQRQDLNSLFFVIDKGKSSQEKHLIVNLMNPKLYDYKILVKEAISPEIEKASSTNSNVSEYSIKMASNTCEYLINHKYPPILRIAPFPDKINSPFSKDLNPEKLHVNNSTNGLSIPNFIVRTLSLFN